VAYGGGTGRRIRGEIPAVLGCGLVGSWAALQRLGGAFLGHGSMDSAAGAGTALDSGLGPAALRLATPEPAATDCASRRWFGGSLMPLKTVFCEIPGLYVVRQG